MGDPRLSEVTGVVAVERMISPLTDGLRLMMDRGVFIDPLLVNSLRRSFAQTLQTEVETTVNGLYETFVQLENFSGELEEVPYAPMLMYFALFHAVVATAVLITHEKTGAVQPSADSVALAEQRISVLIAEVGVAALYKFFIIVMGYDLIQPHVLHRNIPEAEFYEGNRHYPYPTNELQWYLMAGFAHGSLRLKHIGGQRVIQLKRLGIERFEWAKKFLRETGYFQKRVSLSYIYQFDQVRDFDDMCNIVWPDAIATRTDYIHWVGIPNRARVLEVACGTGSLTFEGNLAQDVIGKCGRLTSTDASQNMLQQAERKANAASVSNRITFAQASVENLPYTDGAFDVVIGSAFLHFVEPSVALGEMIRTVKKGGIVTIYQATEVNILRPFFEDWFAPLFEIGQRQNFSVLRDCLPTKSELTGWFRDTGLRDIEVQETHTSWVFDSPEVVVQHLIRGVLFFQSQFVELPWDDRRTITLELMDRGRDVCQRYSLADRTIDIPGLMMKGRRPL